MKYMSPHDFYLATNGKGIDVDGVYGNQCVDLWNYFNKLINDGVYISCGSQGYAYGIYENRASNKAMNYYDIASINALQDGDWVIWGKGSKPCPLSHIAMFRIDNGNGTGIFLGQNQGHNYVTQKAISYNGVIGVLRPKIYSSTPISTKYLPKTSYSGTSIVEGLNSIKVDSSYKNRAKIATQNSIVNYTGTATQNTHMLNLLKQGKLKAI